MTRFDRCRSSSDVALRLGISEMSGIPIFVTADTLLHLYHVQFDETLKDIEQRDFYDDIVAIDAGHGGEDPGAAEHRDVGDRAAHVPREEPPIDVVGGVPPQDVGGPTLEATGPEGHLAPPALVSRAALPPCRSPAVITRPPPASPRPSGGAGGR